ncbi:low-density lipoprotein receptor-like isoform X2 [Mytilus edulis]
MWRQFIFMWMVLIGLHVAKADECSEGELKCDRSEQCYPEEFKCDGTANCWDGTDECGCDGYDCPGNRLKCPDDVCGKEDGKLCDGRSDCPRHKDEQECESCVDGAFHCSEQKKCIPDEWHCDGINDCDGEDEENCAACVNGAFHCSEQKKCIHNEWHCNGIDDCDGEDEENCAECNNDAFLCTADSTCIRSSWVCDSWPDCSDGKDDIGCSYDGCGNDEFKCNNPPPSFPNCVSGDKINDDANDCGDCSDEAFAESCVHAESPLPARSLLKTRGQRKKDDGRVNTVARDSKNVDAHRQPLRRGESHLKDYLRKYLLRSKTDDRLANRNLGRREMDKRKPAAKKLK